NGESALSSIQPGRPSAVLKWSTGDAIQLSTDQRGIRKGDTIRYADGTQVSDQVQLVDTQLVVLEVPMGAEYFVVLSDGTKVWLNAGSTLKYPMHFSAKNREVQLSGEGF